MLLMFSHCFFRVLTWLLLIQDPVAVNISLKTNSYLSCLGLVDLSQVHEILVDLGAFVKALTSFLPCK